MNITVAVKNVYGREVIYPVCNKAKLLAELAGTKTFTQHAIQTVKALGYSIQVAAPTITI